MTTHPYTRLFPKVVAPTVSDDGTLGYEVGDLWVDTAHSKTYQAFSVSTGAASWLELTSSGSGMPSPFALTNDITPTTLAGNQIDYNPTGLATADVLRLSASTDVLIRGLAGASDGRIIAVYNVGSANAIDLIDEDPANTTAGNRFHFSEGLSNDQNLQPSHGIVLYYDATLARWRQWTDHDAASLQGMPVALNIHATANDGYALIYDQFTDVVRADFKLDHDVAVDNVGTNTHAQIDTFIGTTVPGTYATLTQQSTGWIPVTATWTRTGNHTFTLSGDVTLTYRKGTKVRYKDGGSYEYGVIASSSFASSTTTVNLIVNSDYAMAAVTITDTYLSYVETPEGFPNWFSWTVSTTNLTVGSGGSVTGKWKADAQLIHFEVNVTLGTSPTVGDVSFTAPVNTISLGSRQPQAYAILLDAGTQNYYGVVICTSASNFNIRSNDVSGTHVVNAVLSSTSPFTWGNTDAMYISGWYPY